MSDIGPWESNISSAERQARLRAFACMALIFARSHPELFRALRLAEHDSAQLAHARVLFQSVESIPRRRMLSIYADLIRN